jgi:ankyrin repeat protein
VFVPSLSSPRCLLPSFIVFAVWANMSNALAAVDEQQMRDAALRATRLLEESERHTVSTIHCTTCHHTGLKLRLDRVALEHGVPIDLALARRNLESKLGFESRYKMALGRLDSASQGVPVLQPAATIGICLAAAHDLGIAPNLYLSAWARRLARLQSSEGFWPGEDRRPPSQSHEPFSPTAYAVEGLRWYLPEGEAGEKTASLQRARGWLLRTTPKETDEQVMRLTGLRASGAPQGEYLGIARKLISQQRSDGGWGQLNTSASDAYETGRVLVALSEASLMRTTDPVYIRGLNFLLRTQLPDGSWHVPSRLTTPLPLAPDPQDFYFPHGRDDVSSFIGTVWADQALILALKRVPSPPPLYTEEEFSAIFGRDPEPSWVATALFGSPKDLKFLLDHGLDPNSVTKQGVPLLQLVVPDLDKTRLVIASGANINGHAKNGYTALLVGAAYRGTTDVVRLLLKNGAMLKFESTGTDDWKPFQLPMGIPLFPLFQAAQTGEIQKAELLVEPGKTDLMTRALDRAVLSGDTKMVNMLVKAGADVNAGRPLVELNPLINAVVCNDSDMLDALIQLGAEINRRDELGYTALHYAAMINYGNTTIVEKLLNAGALRNAKDPNGLTPIDIARRRGYAHVLAVFERLPKHTWQPN